MNIDEVKKECYKIKAKYYHQDYPKTSDLYFNLIKSYLSKNVKVLNAGCGKGIENIIYKNASNFSVGLDLNRNNLKMNQLHNCLVNADMEGLPFTDEYFDLIISQDVFEHLKNPYKVFGEFSRILKPGGHIVFLTPNIYGYVSIASIFTPFRFHLFFNKLMGRKESDSFPTFYRANSKRRLKKICEKTGFIIKSMTTFQRWPASFVFSKTLFRLGILHERLVNKYTIFSSLRGVIIASFEKV